MDVCATLEETILSDVGEPRTLNTQLALAVVSGSLESAGLLSKVNERISREQNSPFRFFSTLTKAVDQLNFIRATAFYFPEEVFKYSNLVTETPPQHIHRMQKQDAYWVGDFYSSNLVLDALQASNLMLQEHYKVCDVGCSSGSLVRVLAASCPDWELYGCDPIESAVEWASQHVVTGEFSSMGNKPPLRFENQFFDGATAISVWSHHRADAAERWFEEIARVLKSGGWFVVTFCSKHHLLWRMRMQNISPKKLESTMSALRSEGCFFEPMNFLAEENDTGSDWGSSVFLYEAFEQLFCQYFDVAGHFPGLNQKNQDVLVLIRK